MKLYYSQGACSLSVRIAINEMGLKCDFESVNLQTKKTETGKDYWQINPKGAVSTSFGFISKAPTAPLGLICQ